MQKALYNVQFKEIFREMTMRFNDEREMWYADTEALAKRLANKSEKEVQEILDYNDVIQLRSGKRPETTLFNRMFTLILFIPLAILAGIKWCITGDRFLDSWLKKSNMLAAIVKLTSLR